MTPRADDGGPPPSDPIDTDVVVVGAGISGLAAAATLLKRGFTVTVLEARGRVGGRLLSLPSAEGGLDLGATWFWPNQPRIAALVADLGLATHPQYLAGDAMYQDPHRIQRIEGNPIDVPAGRITQGAQELALALARTFRPGAIRLDHPVTEIRLIEDGIAAVTRRGSFHAAHLVLALPPALAISTVDFVPALDDETAAVVRMTPVWMGAVTKVVAQYAAPFWRQRGLAGSAISHVGPMREIHDTSGSGGEPAALFGFVPATRPGQPTVSPEDVVRQLVETFGSDAADPVEIHIRDWRREAYTSPPGVESLQAYEVFGHPLYAAPSLGGRLHWASTETSPEHPGHIEGALAAADRTASAIARALRP